MMLESDAGPVADGGCLLPKSRSDVVGAEEAPNVQPGGDVVDTSRLDLSSLWKLASMVVGIGLFSVPSTFVTLGPAQAAIFLCVFAALADMAMIFLLDVAAEHNLTTYKEVMQAVLGRGGAGLITIVAFITPSLGALSYLGSGRDMLVRFLGAFVMDVDPSVSDDMEVLSSGKSAIILVALVMAVMPLCMGSTLDDVLWIATTGVASMTLGAIYILGDTLIIKFTGCHGCGATLPMFASPSLQDRLSSLGTIAFCFSMVWAVFPTLQDRVQNGDIRMAIVGLKKTVHAANFLVFLTLLLLGLTCSLVFGDGTKSLVVYNLHILEWPTQLVVFCISVTSVLLVPIIAFPAVRVLEEMLTCIPGCAAGRGRKRMLLVYGVFLVLVDTVLPTHVLFALGGSVGLSAASFLLPGLVALGSRLSGPALPMKVGGVLLVMFSLVLLLGTTPSVLMSALDSSTKQKIPIKQFYCKSA